MKISSVVRVVLFGAIWALAKTSPLSQNLKSKTAQNFLQMEYDKTKNREDAVLLSDLKYIKIFPWSIGSNGNLHTGLSRLKRATGKKTVDEILLEAFHKPGKLLIWYNKIRGTQM